MVLFLQSLLSSCVVDKLGHFPSYVHMQMYVYYVSWAIVVILTTWRKSYCPNFNNACAVPDVREMIKYSEACDQWLFCHCSDNPLLLYFLCHPYIFSILYEIFNLLSVSCLQFVTAQHLSHVCMHSSAYSCMSAQCAGSSFSMARMYVSTPYLSRCNMLR